MLRELKKLSKPSKSLLMLSCQTLLSVTQRPLLIAFQQVTMEFKLQIIDIQIFGKPNAPPIGDALLLVTLINLLAMLIHKFFSLKLKELPTVQKNSTKLWVRNSFKLTKIMKISSNNQVNLSPMRLNSLLMRIQTVKRNAWLNAGKPMAIPLIEVTNMEQRMLVAASQKDAVSLIQHSILNTPEVIALYQNQMSHLFNANTIKMDWSYAQKKRITPSFSIQLVTVEIPPLPCSQIHTQLP